ncbi:hypothetical protein CJU89_0198 [Yarrowia sp. B02]|nr:hypothetical protein CJU89_0198 [Yarrowia sp. B02]
MRLSRFTFAFLALTVSADLTEDVKAVLDYAGDLLGPGKSSFSAAVSQIMQNPLVTRVFDDLNHSDHSTEANAKLLDHIHEAMESLFGTTNTAELFAKFSKSSSAKFDNAAVGKMLKKTQEQIGDHLDWVVPTILEDEKLQERTGEFQRAVDVIMVENQHHPMAKNSGFQGLIAKVSPEVIASGSLSEIEHMSKSDSESTLKSSASATKTQSHGASKSSPEPTFSSQTLASANNVPESTQPPTNAAVSLRSAFRTVSVAVLVLCLNKHVTLTLATLKAPAEFGTIRSFSDRAAVSGHFSHLSFHGATSEVTL